MSTGAKIEIEDPGDADGRDSGAESSSVTRRAALGMTAAMTAGLLADRALSSDTARAEGVSSVSGNPGDVVPMVPPPESAPPEGQLTVLSPACVASGGVYCETVTIHPNGKNVYVCNRESGRVAGGIAAPGSHRSRRDSLPSPGSSHQH